jgi:hypothetical protein
VSALVKVVLEERYDIEVFYLLVNLVINLFSGLGIVCRCLELADEYVYCLYRVVWYVFSLGLLGPCF